MKSTTYSLHPNCNKAADPVLNSSLPPTICSRCFLSADATKEN